MKAAETSDWVKITPKIATEWLERHDDVVRARGGDALNRNMNDDLANKYGAMMKAGEWLKNGETIKIASSGRILDGQHRLWGCVNLDASFVSLVVNGVDEEAFVTIDIGRSRKPSDFLTVDGVPNGAVVAAAARIIIGYRRRDMKRIHMISTPEIVAFCKANPRLVESGSKAVTCRAIAPVSTCAAWHFLFSETSAEDADRFIEDIRAGVGLSRGDPVLALRERLIKNRASKAKLPAKEIFIIGLRAWNDRRGGRSRNKVQTVRADAEEVKLPKIA